MSLPVFRTYVGYCFASSLVYFEKAVIILDNVILATMLENIPSDLCAHARFGSACPFAQYNQIPY